MKDIFSIEVTAETIDRIEQLKHDTQPKWGKMNVGQMLAHCCVPYEMIYTTKHPKPGVLKRFLLRLIVKKGVTNEKPYPKSSRTAPEFMVSEKQDFNLQRDRLMAFVKKVQNEGRRNFEGKVYPNFGKMTSEEWNNMFYKHLNHHLNQFGV